MGRQEKEEFKKEEEGSNPTEILYIWISWEWEVRHMNANHTGKVMKQLGNFSYLDFYEYLGWIAQSFLSEILPVKSSNL